MTRTFHPIRMQRTCDHELVSPNHTHALTFASGSAVWHAEDEAWPPSSMPLAVLLFVVLVWRGESGFTECTESNRFPPIFAAELKAPPAAAAAPPSNHDGTA